MNRLALFLLAPVPAAAVGAIVSWATGGYPRPVSVALFYLLQLYALQLIFGSAIAAWLRRTRRQSIGYFAAGGLVMVAVVAVPYLVWASSRPQNTLGRTVVVLSVWLALGAITGVTAWALMRRGQPEPMR